MLSSITPLGERGRNNRWWLTASAYGVGSVLGGASIGGLCGAVGWLAALVLGRAGSIDPALPLGLLAVVAVLGAAADLRLAGLRVPTVERQVDETWIGSYRGWVYGFGFGYQLGLGVVTIVTSAATWVALAAALLTGSVVGGLIVGAAFGLARALPLLLAARVHTPDGLRALHRRNQGWSRRAERSAVAGLLLATAVAVGVGVGA